MRQATVCQELRTRIRLILRIAARLGPGPYARQQTMATPYALDAATINNMQS